MTLYIGIDPGLSGGIAIIRDQAVTTTPMPLAGGELDIAELANWLRRWDVAQGIAVVEKAQSMPKQGIASAFNYGTGYGQVLGLLTALRIRTELVRPTEWKKVILAGTAKDKDAAIAYVRRAFPGVSLLASMKSTKMHDGMADALCLAEYGRRAYAPAGPGG